MNSTFSMSRYFCAFLSPSLMASLSLVGLVSMANSVQAQSNPQIVSSAEIIKIAQAGANYNLLFVNPVSGSDSSDGSNQTPVKTIGRALEMATPNTIVVLAVGTYSAATGEQFPIFMKSGVTIQGESKDRGQQVIIQGSGFYLSRSFARQKVAIVAANRAGLRGVTVTNSEPQGYGLWVESASPVISDNTFTGNTHDGVSVVGSSAPILRNNYFLQNGANGITIYGNSRPELIENIFENTGFGVNIAQNAAPRLIGNRITQNKDGIVIQGNATPILRNNVIDRNSRDGLVAIAQARPDLGNTSEAGGNNFLNNGENDINAKSSNQSIPAVGNQLSKTQGTIDFKAVATVAASNSAPAQPRFASLLPSARPLPRAVGGTAIPVASTQTVSAQTISATTNVAASSPASAGVSTTPPVDAAELPLFNLTPSSRRVQPRIVPKPASAEELSVTRSASSSSRGLPKVPELRVSRPMAEANNLNPAASSLSNTSNQPIAIPINVPPPESGAVVTPAAREAIAAAPVVARGDVLPVPGANIPLGNVGDSPSVPVWRDGSIARPSVASVKFRVLVSAIDPTQVAQTKSIVPGAFSTVFKGQSMMQAGAFSDRGKAEELLNTLQSQGLPASLEQY